MNRFIAVTFPLESFRADTNLRDLTTSQINRFRSSPLVFANYAPERHSIQVYAHHKELPEVIEGCECSRFCYLEARRKFPFLFADNETNALLYRKF